MPPTLPPSARALLALSLVSAALAGVASAWGLLAPALYANDPEVIVPQLRGQDLVTLLLGAPALAFLAWRARQGGMRAAIGQAGMLLYMAYTYATYALGARFNTLFLVYCAILGASTYALFLLVPRLVDEAPGLAGAPIPRRTLVGLTGGIAAVFAILWGSEIIGAMVAGNAPASALEAQTPTSIVHVLDLAWALPLGALCAALLALRRPAGIPLTGVFLVKAATIALAVLAMGAFAWLASTPVNLPVAGAMLAVLVVVLVVGVRYLRALAPVGIEAVTPVRISRPHDAMRGDRRRVP